MDNKLLIRVLQENKYILVRLPDNELIGINCKTPLLTARRTNPDLEKESIAMSYIICDFMEYITHKIPICGKKLVKTKTYKMTKEQKINEFMDWLITESHYPHFFLTSFREEIKGKLKELTKDFDVSVLLFDFWVYTRGGFQDTPKKEVKNGIKVFLSNYDR